MEPIILDFETYYDKKTFSLSQRDMTTEEYVRDERFEVIMCGFHVPGEKPYWVPNHKDAVYKELCALELHKYPVVAHNMLFDGLIIGDHYGLSCAEYYCTMRMARPFVGARDSVSLAQLARRFGLPAKLDDVHDASGKRLKDFTRRELEGYGTYCVRDAGICERLYKILRPRFTKQDMIIISDTLRGFCEPIFRLDKQKLGEYIPQLEQEQHDLLVLAADFLEIDSTDELKRRLGSNPQFAELLTSLGCEIPMKPATGKVKENPDGTPKMTYAFAKNDLGFKALLEDEDDLVRTVCEARVNVKSNINMTRAIRFTGIAERGPLPFALEPFKAGTTRWGGCEKYNLQNLPKRKGDKTLRQAMRAPRGWVIGVCDLSQIEARRMADHAGQMDLVEAFRHEEDPYSQFATELYGYPVSKGGNTDTERNVGKECILSLQYSAWYHAFRSRLYTAYGIRLDEEFAKDTVMLYRRKMYAIKQFWDECEYALEIMLGGGTFDFGRERNYTARKGEIILPDGWSMKYEDMAVEGKDSFGRPIIRYTDRTTRARRKVHRGIIANNCTQGSAARILQWQIAQIRSDEYFPMFMRGTVHDELIFIEEERYAREMMECATYWMKQAPSWAKGTPINCEFTIGPTYGDQYKFSKWKKAA